MKLTTITRTFPALLVIFAVASNADVIVTHDNSRLMGEITVITPESITMETDYAGTIDIDPSKVKQIHMDSPRSTRLEDGTVVTGKTEITGDGVITVVNENMSMSAPMDEVLASWQPDDEPPEAAGFPMKRSWRYTIGADITGKRGNSKENGASVRGQALLIGPSDELKFYLTMDRADTDSEKTSDEIIFGSSYVSYFSEKVGWFVSTELERDPFEGIDLRASTSAGLSYWLWNRIDHHLQLQTGLGYRHESFEDDSSDDTPTLDIGLEHFWQFEPWLNLATSLSYVPSITDFDDFQFIQDTGLNMPIGDGRWNLRVGLKNSYQNEPAAGRKKLDTTYYTRLLLSF